MKHKQFTRSLSVLTALAALMCAVAPSQAADKKPNILFIMSKQGSTERILSSPTLPSVKSKILTRQQSISR